MNNMKNNEIEIKITMDNENLNKLLNLAIIKENTVAGSERVLKLKNVYYDTKSKNLGAKRIVYRVRTTNDKEFEATIKTEKEVIGGYSSRMEYNVPLINDEASIKGFKEQGFPLELETILAGEKLEILFTMLVERKRSLIQITENTLVEMAIDQGKITAGSKSELIDEVEFELVQGEKGDLIKFVEALKERIIFKGERRSKYKRGLDLLK